MKRMAMAVFLAAASAGLVEAQSSRPGMGCILYADGGGTGATFRVWAPHATNMAVRGDFNGWTDTPLVAEGNGNWSADVSGVQTGQQYNFRVNGLSDERDPRARRVTNSGASGKSIVYDPDAFDWGGVSQPKPSRKDIVIYQMHVGTYEGGSTPQTFDDAITRLDHLTNLGVNVVQVMPINEFAGSQSWGYNPADQMAVESSYGGADGFKRFVKACHQRGMAVFVDVVHNHYGPSDLSLWRFDGWYQGSYGGIYFYNDGRASTPWGSTRPDFGRSEVRDLIHDQILMYVQEYRVGGFRWDAPYYIINTDQGHNQSGEYMLRDINWELSQDYSYVVRIGEDNAFDYSMNFQDQWDVDWRWKLHDQVTISSDANRNMYTVRDLLRDWASLNHVIFSEAHDYVASNNGRTRLPTEIDSGNPESIYARRRSLLAAGIVMTAPGIPMIFQGQEMLETQAFHDNVPLRWDRTNTFAGIVRAYSDLIHVRRNLRGGTKGLKGTGINVHHVDNNNKVVGFIRWDAGGQSDDVVVIANFANKAWTNNSYYVGFPSDGTWYRHYNSDSTNYQSDFGNIGPTQIVVSGGTAAVNMGKYSLQIFTKTAPTGQPGAPDLPGVATTPIIEITNTTAKAGGNVSSDGGASVTERGVVWSTNSLPTTNDTRGTAGSGTGTFTNLLTGLTTGLTYHVRAYAINSAGVAYGSDVSFHAGVVPEAPANGMIGGVTVLEAENFSVNLSPRSSHDWIFSNTVAGFSGAGYMEGLPDNNFVFTNWAATSPELRYPVLFSVATTHFVWVRGYGVDNASDSVHWGLNGVTNAGSGINWTNYNAWVWTNRVTATTVATLNVTSAGTNTIDLWMREDGARIDRMIITTNASFRPITGTAWHVPEAAEPAGQYAMRNPFQAIFTNTPVTIYNGNIYQGAGAGSQIPTNSFVYYRHATGTVWSSVAMSLAGASGNSNYFSGVIPAGQFQPGDVVLYYLKVSYGDVLPVFLCTSNGAPLSTEDEAVAQASPFSYTVLNAPLAGSPSPADWRDINIYQVFTDRFNDGDPTNNNVNPQSAYAPAVSNRIHGGDFKGIERKLDYIKALGARAIWITPVQLNVGNASYHGYNALNFYELAPQLGTLDDLVSLVASAHAKGIYVLLDVVCNHQGRLIDSGDAGFPAYNAAGYTQRWTTATMYPAPFNSLSNFHGYGQIDNFNDAQQLVLGELAGLDDLKTETLQVRTNLVDVFKSWLELADLDGLRLDTVKHVDIGFWQYFNAEMRAFAAAMGKTNFIQFGEAYDTTESGNGYFTGTMAGGAYANDTVLDFPLFSKIDSVFSIATGNTKALEDHYNAISTNYHTNAQMRLVTFLDSHDEPRFMSAGKANGNTNRLALALSFLYTARGIPNLYYGTEQEFNGGGDPANREDLFDGAYEQGPSVGDNFNMTKGSFLHIAKLNNFRRLYPSLRTGEHINRWNTPGGPGLFAYARRTTNEEVFVVLNTSGSSQTLTNRKSFYAPGTQLVNLFDTNEVITINASTNTPLIVVPATSFKMFVAASQWLPLDPVVDQQSPAHGATNASVTGPLVLRFSKTMDTNSVQAAFEIDPPAAGTFSWASNRTVMTFTPGGGTGLAWTTRYTIRVNTNAVDAESGNALFAPFETWFVSASAPDADNDSVPDWWTQQYFGHSTGQVGDLSMSWQDADADEFDNLLEYIAGTDPTNGASYFVVTAITPDDVALPSVPGRLYQIEANDITDQVWSVVASNQAGTGGMLSIPVSNAVPARWIRARVQMPP